MDSAANDNESRRQKPKRPGRPATSSRGSQIPSDVAEKVEGLIEDLIRLAGSGKDLERLVRRSRPTIARYRAVNRPIPNRAVPSREDAIRFSVVHSFLEGDTVPEEQVDRATVWLRACGHDAPVRSALLAELEATGRHLDLPAASDVVPREYMYLCREPIESLIPPGKCPSLERLDRMQMMRACELTQLIARDDISSFRKRASGGTAVFVPRLDPTGNELAKQLDPARTPATIQGVQDLLMKNKSEPTIAPLQACWILLVDASNTTRKYQHIERAFLAMRSKLPTNDAARLRLFEMRVSDSQYVHATDWWFYVPSRTDEAKPFGQQVLVNRRLLDLIEDERVNPHVDHRVVERAWAFSCLVRQVDDDEVLVSAARFFGLEDAVADHQQWNGDAPVTASNWKELCSANTSHGVADQSGPNNPRRSEQ